MSGNVGSDSYGQMLTEEMHRHHVCRDLVGVDDERIRVLGEFLTEQFESARIQNIIVIEPPEPVGGYLLQSTIAGSSYSTVGSVNNHDAQILGVTRGEVLQKISHGRVC